MSTSRRPLILWLVVVAASFAALVNMLGALGAITPAGLRPWSEVIGHFILSVVVATASGWVAYSPLKAAFRSKLPVSVYLWVMLLLYPVNNVFRALGLYLPRPEIPPEQVAGAATAELLRYALLLALIIWVESARHSRYTSRSTAQRHQ
jgi:hypothetical protein